MLPHVTMRPANYYATQEPGIDQCADPIYTQLRVLLPVWQARAHCLPTLSNHVEEPY